MGSLNRSPCPSCGKSDSWLQSKIKTTYNRTISWEDSWRIILGVLFATLTLVLLLSSAEDWISHPKFLLLNTADPIARSLANLRVSTASVTWIPDDRFTFQNSTASEAWRSSYPASLGFVGPPVKTFEEASNSGPFYSISMYHQLHCLELLKEEIFPSPGSSHHHANEILKANDHLKHCVQFLRQAIICAADTTLERADPVSYDGELFLETSGWNVEHKCRDSNVVFDFATENAPF